MNDGHRIQSYEMYNNICKQITKAHQCFNPEQYEENLNSIKSAIAKYREKLTDFIEEEARRSSYKNELNKLLQELYKVYNEFDKM